MSVLEELRQVTSEARAVTVARYLSLECQRRVARKLGIQQPAVSKRLVGAAEDLYAATGRFVDFTAIVRQQRRERAGRQLELHHHN